jgi:TPR repeat protein
VIRGPLQIGSVLLSAKNRHDPRSLCFAALLLACDKDGEGLCDVSLLELSAEQGYAFVQAWMAFETRKENAEFRWAQLSAAQGERDGYHALGYLHTRGDKCEKNLGMAKYNYLRAANLGHCDARYRFAKLLDGANPGSCVLDMSDQSLCRLKI